jgi:DNA (cytosine-5)-methyltransferase 1
MLPKIIDLFSGCGGLALGFQKAGFEIAAGIDILPEAIKAISYNLHWRTGQKEVYICADITAMDPKEFINVLGDEGCIVIGGPPCQAYSLAGRGKLRSLGDNRIYTKDQRGLLYKDFIRFAIDLNARAVIMENVPEAINYGGENIPQHICEVLESKGYFSFWTILNAADFGVPQIRERVFVIAVKQNENITIDLPEPSHRNSDGSMTVYQKRFIGLKRFKNFKQPKSNKNAPDLWNTVGDAFSDLPVLFENENASYRSLSLNVEIPYRCGWQNDYQRMMRTWFGTATQSVSANAFRKCTRDFPIFARMKQGDNYIKAVEIAEKLFKDTADLYALKEGTVEYDNLRRKIVPPYETVNFDSRWKKLDDNKPSHTVTAHLSRDTYSHIHPWEPRGISVREAARLQSFPDDFFFNCSMGDAFNLIGNAVPPLLAYSVALSVRDAFMEEFAYESA